MPRNSPWTPRFGVRDTVKGMVPDHICIVQVCFTQGCEKRPQKPRQNRKTPRKTSTQPGGLEGATRRRQDPEPDPLPPRRHEGGRNGHHRPSRQIGIFRLHDRHVRPGQPACRCDRGECRQEPSRKTEFRSFHIEGLPNCDWVLIDSGDVIVHVFRPRGAPEFYNLERLWTQGPTAAA